MLHFTFQTEQKCLPFLNIVKSLKYFSAIEAFDMHGNCVFISIQSHYLKTVLNI